jgi:AraC-like DNA-binding protein
MPLLPCQNEFEQCLPAGLGTGSTIVAPLDEDLSYIETRYTPSRDLAIVSRVEHPDPRLVVTLCIAGASRFSGSAGDEVIFREGYSTVTTFASSLGEREYEADRSVVQLRLSLSRHWLDRHFGPDHCPHLFERGALRVVSHRPISGEAQVAARQLLAGGPAGPLKRLFIQGQALSILAAELDCLGHGTQGTDPRFLPRDMAAAHRARQILLDEYQTPPSVEELARRVGINQFKLKQLFHGLFRTTPYALLLETRMHQAYRMLESTRCQVGAAARAVGYGHASNFSTAFLRYFGVSPNSVRRKS